jgi:hypothetical protein
MPLGEQFRLVRFAVNDVYRTWRTCDTPRLVPSSAMFLRSMAAQAWGGRNGALSQTAQHVYPEMCLATVVQESLAVMCPEAPSR